MEHTQLGEGATLRTAPADMAQRLWVAQNLSDMAWALADRGHADPELFELIAARCGRVVLVQGWVLVVVHEVHDGLQRKKWIGGAAEFGHILRRLPLQR